MLKAAIEKILSLDAPHIEEIEGRTYVDKDMTQIGKELRATNITMSNLSSLVDFIKKSKADFKTGHYIAQVVSPTEVRLFSSLDADRQRETLAVVKAEIPEFSFGQFIGNEEFVIGVQSKFLNEDAEANDKPIILQFAGNVKAGTVAEYGDTGVGQKAAIKKGVASLQEVEVPSPCRLMPYRTFTEVAQPMSNFIFRVKDNDRLGVTCALFEADAGNFNTSTEPTALEKTGLFEKKVAVTASTQFKPGDILVTKTKGHTVVVVSVDGSTPSSTSTPAKPAASTSSSKKVESAKSKDAAIAGKYKTTGNLYLRVGAGTGKTAITLMPKGSDVQCYGYYTSYNGTRWYYVAYGNLTGFCSSEYLKRA